MKLALFIFLTVFHCQNAYKIVTLPKADEDHHSMKVFFSTKMVHKTQLTTTTVTETAFETCYAAEPGIAECKNRRDNEESEPKVELNGVETSWQSIISPSRTARVQRQVDLEEEIVEIVEASENVQVIQPDEGEPAAVVYASVVHKSREEEPVVIEQELEELSEAEPFEDELELESRTEENELARNDHENLVYHHEQVDNADELVSTEFDDESEGDMITTEIASDETTTSEPEMSEMTTIMEELPDYELEEVNPARENLEAPILLESSWEEKEVVITNSIDTKCMDMKNDLFINVMSTLVSTVVKTETVTVNGLNSVLFKSEGGCLPSDVNEMFSSSCV